MSTSRKNQPPAGKPGTQRQEPKPPRELAPEETAFRIDPASLPEPDFREDRWEIIGQPRALKALEKGTRLHARGYNIFLSGPSGTGKRTAVEHILEQNPRSPENLKDMAFVFNFKRPERPLALTFPPGQGEEFQKSMHRLTETLKDLIRRRLAGETFKQKRDDLLAATEQEENRSVSAFEQQLNRDGFTIVRMEDDEGEGETADIAPVLDDEITDFDELQQKVSDGEMAEEEWNALRQKYYRYMDEMKSLFQKLRTSHIKMEEGVETLQKETIAPDIREELDRLFGRFPQAEGLEDYRTLLEEDILSNLILFTGEAPSPEENGGEDPFLRYGVNILLDNSRTPKAPVVFESNPSPANLFGTIESRFEMGGESRTDFTMIKPGSLIQASGGYLILNMEDLLKEQDSWTGLKRALEQGKLEIQPPITPLSLPGNTLKPEPLPLDVKVIILAPEGLYDILCSQDSEFEKHFKIPAEFDPRMPLNHATLQEYINFMEKDSRHRERKPLDPGAKAAVIEYGVRLSGRKDRLTTQFSRISDLLLEAEHLSQKNPSITSADIEQAETEKIYLHSLPEEKIYDEILDGTIRIDTTGDLIGQVNGLAVLERSYYAFGCPMLITCQTAPGDRGIINIEREAGLSGQIHDKGLLIIEGFMRSRYAKEFPLSLNASLCFEQSYNDIDGDSASSAEVYALLSAVTGLPLRQDIAVTGSVNQMGRVQAVGGVTEKVEGFFKICSARGLTGSQGVIIPEQNINSLNLRREAAEAVRQGRFHIYPAASIDDGIAILTSTAAGKLPPSTGKEEPYPPGTVNRLAAEALRELYKKSNPS